MRGWLTGRWRTGAEAVVPTAPGAQRLTQLYDLSLPGNQRKLEAADALARLAEEAGMTLIELAIAFVINHPAVTAAIIGPRTMEQLESQLPAADVVLDPAILDRIDEIVAPGENLHGTDIGWDNPCARAGREAALMELGLAGRGVLVTGGAGGIGAATVRAFAAEGARVAIHYRSSGEAAEALARATDGVALRADLTYEHETEALVAQAVEALGRLDVCVANAGVHDPQHVPIWESSLERFRAGIDGNLVTTWLTCRAFLRHVRTTGTGSLVLVGSTAGIHGEAGHAEYAAAKGAINVGLCARSRTSSRRSRRSAASTSSRPAGRRRRWPPRCSTSRRSSA